MVVVNQGSKGVDVGCWGLRSASTSESLTLAEGQTVPPGAAIRIVPESALFRSTDTVTLVDAGSETEDASPELTDDAGDDRVWFRAAGGAWQLGRPTLPAQVIEAALDRDEVC